MTKDELMEKMREDLKKFDDARYGWMLKIWAKVSGSPQKAAYLALGIFVVAFILGRLSN